MNQGLQPTLQILADQDEVAKFAAGLIADQVQSNPASVLGLATGSSPVACYQELIRRHRDEGLDFSRVTSFNLDEYVGLPPDHSQSYREFMQQNLFNHINIDPDRTHVPDGLTNSVDEHCRDYEASIQRAGGIDLQLLGIGNNGHIAFNEPGARIDSRTRQIALADDTIQSNARFFDSPADVPRAAITMGVGTIMESKQIILIATGQSKATAVAAALNGPVTEECPASFLQRHPCVTFVLDQSAASEL